MEVLTTRKFDEQYDKLPVDIQKKAEKQEKLFKSNPLHPSLHTEKLSPKFKEVWSFRVDRSHRIIFRFLSRDKVLFLNIGPHDWIYRF
ncbi:MAG: type II toxin-antitoxin system mRNA interferase toxin, RelE/StbE family [Patescibacteria group bacterium]|mgnify:CR=1 FL=1